MKLCRRSQEGKKRYPEMCRVGGAKDHVWHSGVKKAVGDGHREGKRKKRHNKNQ